MKGSPKILDRDYKIEHTFDHRAKFRGDRPTELGDHARENKEKTTAKLKVRSASLRFRADK